MQSRRQVELLFALPNVTVKKTVGSKKFNLNSFMEQFNNEDKRSSEYQIVCIFHLAATTEI